MPSTLQIINSVGRVPLFVFTAISLGLTAHLRSDNYNVARNNLGLAASVITLILSVFVAWIVLLVDAIFSIFPLIAFDFISFALLLAASASMTAQRSICHTRGKCGEFRAAIAFLYMAWIILLFVFILDIYQIFDNPGAGGSRSGFRDRKPTIGQFPQRDNTVGTKESGYLDEGHYQSQYGTEAAPVVTQETTTVHTTAPVAAHTTQGQTTVIGP